MSIEIENPVTVLEKADALTNLIEQMFIAHQVGDEGKLNEAHRKAGIIGFDLVRRLQRSGTL